MEDIFGILLGVLNANLEVHDHVCAYGLGLIALKDLVAEYMGSISVSGPRRLYRER